jgi:hypothetical protein
MCVADAAIRFVSLAAAAFTTDKAKRSIQT